MPSPSLDSPLLWRQSYTTFAAAMKLRRSAHRREKSEASHRARERANDHAAHGALAEGITLIRPKLAMRCSQGPSRRVRPPFRLAVQKDGRWPRAGAARERRCQVGEVKHEAACRRSVSRQRHAALKSSISWVSRMSQIKEPERLFRVPWVRPLSLTERLFPSPRRPPMARMSPDTRLLCCCHEHGRSRIISPIDDIDDEYRPRQFKQA
jgi:hypothetical protein